MPSSVWAAREKCCKLTNYKLFLEVAECVCWRARCQQASFRWGNTFYFTGSCLLPDLTWQEEEYFPQSLYRDTPYIQRLCPGKLITFPKSLLRTWAYTMWVKVSTDRFKGLGEKEHKHIDPNNSQTIDPCPRGNALGLDCCFPILFQAKGDIGTFFFHTPYKIDFCRWQLG